MDSHDETYIPFSRGKTLLMLAGAIAFAAVGGWLLTLDSQRISADRGFRLFFNNPAFAYGLGAISILVFGGFGMIAARRLLDKRPGLILNSEGFVDNASSASVGFVPWGEVAGLDVFEMSGQRMLIVFVHDPEKYLALGNAIKQKIHKANYNMAGSPISISANTLMIEFDELVAEFGRYLEKYSQSSLNI